MKRYALVLSLALPSIWACGDDDVTGNDSTSSYSGMAGAIAHCEFDILTFKLKDGSSVEVSVNGLSVEAMPGAVKVDGPIYDVVQRRGVRFSDIFMMGDITTDDATPVNCIARDNWDPLRGPIGNDTSKIPRFDFMRDHGYVYVGNPGDKDPLYPEMEGRSLLVDYDMTGDDDPNIPPYVSSTPNLAALGKFRYKMVEKIDDTTKGVFEIDPVP